MSDTLACPTRRRLLQTGAIIVGFSISGANAQQSGEPQRPAEGQNVAVKPEPQPELPGSLKTVAEIDAWIRIDSEGVTIVTGKAELGQGLKTAVLQVACEELVVDIDKVKLITADTGRTPNEGYTAGSQSMQDSATALRHAAAQAREILIEAAARQWNIDAATLRVERGEVIAPDGRRLPYSQIASRELLHVRAQPKSRLRPVDSYRFMGKPVQRVDIPAKVTGAPAYVQDMRPQGMVHARVLRPPTYGARLEKLDTTQVEKLPGVLKVVRDGSFAAVVAAKEYQAVRALSALAQGATWSKGPALPQQREIYDWMAKAPIEEYKIADRQNAARRGSRTLEASYRRPFHIHGSIGPSCAIALYDNESWTIWSHSQGVYPLRESMAAMLRVPSDRIRIIHAEGSGCYGHNAADDAASDAALIARAFPGRPVRVHWMREQEHAWEPFGSAMTTSARASLDGDGAVAEWEFHVWSGSHLTRPNGAPGNVLPALYLETPFVQPVPKPLPQPSGGGDRNAIALYTFPNQRVVHHYLPQMPLRVSALRALGAYMNIFSIESFMDELALAASADPVEFRLRHLQDERARDVVKLAAEKFGWKPGQKPKDGHGVGFAFARYKNSASYFAVAMEVAVDRESGRVRPVRVVAAADAGQIVNPDGVRNQLQGGVVQSLSWTLHEEVSFTPDGVISRDWSAYPILRFSSLPDTLDIHLIDRPGQPFLGAGEAAQGPAAAALANAVGNALGARIRQLPLSQANVKAAIGV